MKKSIRGLVTLFGWFLITLSACGSEEVYHNSQSVISNSDNEYSNQSVIEFQPDYAEGEENTTMLSGPVISQGKWIYYCMPEGISKMDEQENVYTIYTMRDVSQISVLGDWVYYYVSNKFGRVRTDGTNNEVLLNDIRMYGKFLVQNDKLYYVEEKSVSASKENYIFTCYNLVDEKEEVSKLVGTGPSNILGCYNDKIYITIIDVEDNYDQYVVKIDINNYIVNEISEELIDFFQGGFIYKNQLIYSKNLGFLWASASGVTTIYVANLDNETMEFTAEFEFGKQEGELLGHGLVSRICGVWGLSDEEY